MNQKKLYKDMRNKMVCGVCSGIGDYINLDANIVRLLFVIASWMGGLGLFVYVIAAIILPEEP